jgi:solute carrier family 25 (mitochondrial oxoglutarate transporter), member 11
MRQIVYGTARLGLYQNFIEAYKRKNGGANTTFMQKTISSFAAGGIGAFVGNPCDLALVRFQNDTVLPEAERRNYKNVFDAFTRIVQDEGVFSLWKGAGPTVIRAISVNVAMLVSYDTVKEMLTTHYGKGHDFKISVYASMVSAVCTAVISLPFDNVKTKLQKQKAVNGVYPYSGMADCFRKSIAREGVTGLWAGLPTYYFRVGPHAVITLITAEQYRRMLGVGK